MASSKAYLNYILEQLSDVDAITHRAMMGEYILYCDGKILGGIYDDRLLVKPTDAAIQFMGKPTYATPYEGAKDLILVENVDDKSYLTGLVAAMRETLPLPKGKKRN